MNNIQVLPMGPPVGALVQTELNPFEHGSLFDEDISVPESVVGLLTDPRRKEENSEAGDGVLRVMGAAEMIAAHGRGFLEHVRAALNGHTTIEIDLSQTVAMDCAGLGALIAIRNLARDRNGVVRLVNPSSCLHQLLDLMRAEQVFEVVISSH